MEIVRPWDTISKKTAITIGLFDGVHLGHRQLINTLFDESKTSNLCPIVYTFSNHPIKESVRTFITTLNERLYLLEKIGVTKVYLAELNPEFMKLSPVEFVKNELVSKLNVRLVVVGENFRFGYKKEGNINTLIELGNRFNFKVIILNQFSLNGLVVSSSLIHGLIKDGLVEEASTYLGHTYFLQGMINQGKGLGRHLGFPTANLNYEDGNKLLPKNGVYITVFEVNGELYPSVTNVGFNPTFEEKKKIHVEAHVLGVEDDFYGKFIRLHFIKRIRDELKFEHVQDLRKQVMNDIEITSKYFSTHPITSFKIL